MMTKQTMQNKSEKGANRTLERFSMETRPHTRTEFKILLRGYFEDFIQAG